jgi:hypothetical protein
MTAPECSLDKETCKQEGTSMAIRKHGAKTGEIIGVEPDGDGIQAVAGSHAWRSGDDSELGAENAEADQAGDPAQDG